MQQNVGTNFRVSGHAKAQVKGQVNGQRDGEDRDAHARRVGPHSECMEYAEMRQVGADRRTK